MPVRVHSIVTDFDREQAFAIRRQVFIVEQRVPPEEEFDDDDLTATHVLATIGDVAVGTGRIVFQRDGAKIGRMAVVAELRRAGVGRALLERLIAIASERGVMRLLLHAQTHAIPFYEALGFRVIGAEFDEAGIPHRKMERVDVSVSESRSTRASS